MGMAMAMAMVMAVTISITGHCLIHRTKMRMAIQRESRLPESQREFARAHLLEDHLHSHEHLPHQREDTKPSQTPGKNPSSGDVMSVNS